VYWRGFTYFTPFTKEARGNKQKTESLKPYRLVVTKETRKEGQRNLFLQVKHLIIKPS
jgi:hypothetical protein